MILIYIVWSVCFKFCVKFYVFVSIVYKLKEIEMCADTSLVEIKIVKLGIIKIFIFIITS